MLRIGRLLLVIVLGLALSAGMASPGFGSQTRSQSAKAKRAHHKKKRTRLCKHGEKPHGKYPCRRPPRGIVRPPGRSQQGGPNNIEEIPKGAGLGAGGQIDRGENAITWARTFRNQSAYAWRCERFVENAFNVTQAFDSAAAAQKSATLSRTEAPRGALVYFRPDDWNRRLGHVGISLGNGRMISAFDRVVETNYASDPLLKASYAGWTDAPADWPGRLNLGADPDPGLQVPPTTTTPGASESPTVSFTSPVADATLSGIVTLTAQASNASGVEFDAFYATNPADVNTLGWHKLGSANTSGDGNWSLPYDTHAIPDQGNPDWTTVNLQAVVTDAAGAPTTARDYRRVNVSNPVAPVTPPPPAAPTTYAETTGGVSHTWTNYTNAGGSEGPTIGSNATVQIACKVTGFRVADGNTWWYRIASSPWNNAYYVSADAFYNNGATSGSLHGTPFVDPVVPNC